MCEDDNASNFASALCEPRSSLVVCFGMWFNTLSSTELLVFPLEHGIASFGCWYEVKSECRCAAAPPIVVSACAVYDIMNGLFGECNRRKRVANPLSVGRVLACGREFEDRCTLGFNAHSTFGTMGCALHYIGLIQG